ncbi:MAG: hypothetical protein NXI09_05245 [Bacteroidetes bacterium]|nr:hypothetical protein [Bacteroidota bacterium]
MLHTKKFLGLMACLIWLTACNRESENKGTTDPPMDPPNDVVMNAYSFGELQGQMIALNDTFVLNNKTGSVQLEYLYRAYAEPVTFPASGGGTTTLSATAIYAINDMVFVTWHIPSATYGGAICAYRQSGIGRYTFTDRVDFPEADYFELAASENPGDGYYEVFMVGQRDPDASNYVLENHSGAVVTRIDYDFINDEFWEASAKELPLPGPAATDIVAAAAHYFVITGDGSGGSIGGLYQVDRNLGMVEKADQVSIDDGVALIIDPTSQNVNAGINSDATIYALDRSGGNYRISRASVSYDYTTDQTNFVGLSPYSDNSAGPVISPIDDERGDLTWAQGSGAAVSKTDSLIIASGYEGIFEAGSTMGGSFNTATNFGPCLATEFDPSLGVLYYADANDGVRVVAMGAYASGNTLNEYDLIGNFVPPTDNNAGTVLPSTFYIKEIALYRSRNIALATGDAGVYFLQKLNGN